MKRNYIKFIMMVCVGGVLLLSQYCPYHLKAIIKGIHRKVVKDRRRIFGSKYFLV